MRSSSGPLGTDLRVRLLWLTIFRTVGTTLVLIAVAAQFLSQQRVREFVARDAIPFAIIGTVYVLTLVTALLLRGERGGRGVAWVQVAFDIAIASAVVFLTGGRESPFGFLFLLAVVGASALLGRSGALVAAAGAAASTLAILVGLAPSHVAGGRLAVEVTTQILAQILIAVLSGYVAEQLFSTGGRLEEREQDLQALTQLHMRIVESISSGLMTCDEEGLVTYVNPAGLAMLGLSAAEARGVPLTTLLPGVERLRGQRRSELRVNTTKGERTLGLTVSPLHLEGSAKLVVFQDLTDLRRVEGELGRIDQLAALGRVSAQLAHEIRNPLASMRGSAQMLASDLGGSAQERLARLIMRESDRLAELVESYLRLARPPPPALVTTRLDRVAEETLEMLAADPTVAGVSIDTQLERVEARLDAGQMKQVLINLVRNAVAAVGRSGRVRVSTRVENGAALLEVWDSAGAIPPDELGRIFEPFFSKRVGGTGLGLSTVNSIVLAHGGTISVSSEPEQGTTFVVRLVRPEE